MAKMPTEKSAISGSVVEPLGEEGSGPMSSLPVPEIKPASSSNTSKASSTENHKSLSPLFHILLCWLVLLIFTNPKIIAPSALTGYAHSLIHIVYQLPFSWLSWPQLNQPYPAVTDTRIIRLRRAIIGQESGANYRAVNPHSGALGYGQVMPANVPVWTKQALGRSLTSQQFLNDPDAQIATIDYKIQQYWREAQAVTRNENEIVRRVAAKWYSGNPNLWKNTRTQYYNGYAYPSIANYTYSILLRYREQR